MSFLFPCSFWSGPAARVCLRPIAGYRACALVIALAMVLLSGCATSHRFTVEAVRYPVLVDAPASFRLVGAWPPGRDGPRPIEELAARSVVTALSSRGLFAAPPGVAPEMAIEFDFGLEGPVQRTVTNTEPVYATVSAPPVMGRGGADERAGRGLPRKLGDREVTRTVLVYEKFLRLTARPAATREQGAPSPRPLWSVVVTNESTSDDLAAFVPLLAAAALDALDQDTRGARDLVLTANDPRVRFITRGL